MDLKPGIWEGRIPGEGNARMYIYEAGDGQYDADLTILLDDRSQLSDCFQLERGIEGYYFGSNDKVRFKGTPQSKFFEATVILEVIDETFTIPFHELSPRDEKEYLKNLFLMHYDSRSGSRIFSPAFSQLMSKVEEEDTDGEIGYFDYDVFLQAQEYVPIKQIEVQVEQDKATVTAQRYDGAVLYHFIKVEGIWLVDDIESHGISEKQSLEQYIREYLSAD